MVTRKKITSATLLFLVCASAMGQLPKGRIVYSSWQQQDNQLYIINADGSGERELMHSERQGGLPSIFHNRVAYTRVEGGIGGKRSILVTGISGGPVRLLIDNDNVCYPRWKPDGSLIAYEYYPGSDDEIWVMDSNGNNKRLLIADARHPCWSHDNKTIFFTRNYEMYRMDLQTGAQTQITHLGAKHISAKFPAVSPDDKKLAFVVYYNSDNKIRSQILDLETGKQKIIENASMPVWTNDPRFLVATCHSNKGGGSQLAIINAETLEKIFVTNNNRSNDEPAWIGE